MKRVYKRVNWEDYPSEKTPINESNLNKMDSAIETIDGRVVELSNRLDEVEGGVQADDGLSETSENPVQNKVITSKLNEVFQSVSNGKGLIASAITDKGILTDATATFQTMADSISRISVGISYAAVDIETSICEYSEVTE